MGLMKKLGGNSGLRRRRIDESSGAAPERVLTGEVEIDTYFAELPDKLEKKALRKATREVAKLTRTLAVEYAPERTGELVRSIKVRSKERSRAKGMRHVVGTSVTVGKGLFVGDQFYGGFMEFGTAERKHKSGKSTGRVPAGRFDFLRRALWAHPTAKAQIYLATLRQWVAEQRGAAKTPA